VLNRFAKSDSYFLPTTYFHPETRTLRRSYTANPRPVRPLLVKPAFLNADVGGGLKTYTPGDSRVRQHRTTWSVFACFGSDLEDPVLVSAIAAEVSSSSPHPQSYERQKTRSKSHPALFPSGQAPRACCCRSSASMKYFVAQFGNPPFM